MPVCSIKKRVIYIANKMLLGQEGYFETKQSHK
jgi:hypothetical protein